MRYRGLSACLLLLIQLAGAQFVKVGICQPAIDWRFPEIHSLSSAHGKIYMGYGDWNAHPGPVVLTSYNPATGVILAEHSLNTDSIGAMREINGKLYIPSIDPIHYQHFEDYTVIHSDGHIERRTPAGFLHLYDIIESRNEDFFILGSQTYNEEEVRGGTVYRSSDAGVSWENHHPALQLNPLPELSSPSRYYWGFADSRGVHFEKTTYQSFWDEGPLNFTTADKVESIGDFAARLTLMIIGKTPGFSGKSGTLVKINNSGSTGSVATGVRDYAIHGNSVYLLESSGDEIKRIQNITLNNTALPYQWSPPTSFSSLHILDNVLYGGSEDGALFAVRLDNQALDNQPPQFENALPERAGEAIDVDGNRMVISAPRTTRMIEGKGTFLEAGEVALYERTSPTAPWALTETFSPSIENLDTSGTWFGSHLDLHGDDLIVVSGGLGLGSERGNSADLFSIRKEAGHWTWRSKMKARYAHDVALINNRVFSAANTGSGGSHIQEISRFEDRDFNKPVRHSPTSTLYHPYGVFAYDRHQPSHLFFGQTGDLSRGAGNGQVSIFRSDSESLLPIQTLITAAGGQDRFGFSLAIKGDLLAVGAPFADVTGLQAGAVSLYRRNEEGLFAHIVNLFASDAETEAHFGHALALTRGGILYISAPGAKGPNGRRGAVYALRNNNNTWEELAKFTPPAGQSQTWEFGMTLEPDGHQVMVASAQTDESRPYLERMTILPGEITNFTDWAKFQGLADSLIAPLSPHPGMAATQLEAYALGIHPDEQPHFQVNIKEPCFCYLRRTDADARGLTYRAQLANDLNQWTTAENESSESLAPGWERVTIPTPDPRARARVIINLSE